MFPSGMEVRLYRMWGHLGGEGQKVRWFPGPADVTSQWAVAWNSSLLLVPRRQLLSAGPLAVPIISVLPWVWAEWNRCYLRDAISYLKKNI